MAHCWRVQPGVDLAWKCGLVVLVLGACVPVSPAASSREVMGVERSRVMVMRPIKDAALDITRLFTRRGFLLADYEIDDRGITLRFQGERKVVRESTTDYTDELLMVAGAFVVDQDGNTVRHRHRVDHVVDVAFGSAFYVRIEPRGETATSITAIGRPMKNGREACTPDPDIRWPCDRIIAIDSLSREIAGIAEAEIVEGVFSELWLKGDVISPDPATLRARHAAQLAEQRCLKRQRELRELASRVSVPQARAGILGAAATCRTGERVEAAPTR
jgi:hypothetical protein